MHPLLLGLLASGLSATAVQLGFGGAFVSDAVGWGTTAYATAFAVLVSGNWGGSHFTDKVWVRVPLSFSVGGLSLALLRGPLLFSLPGSEFATTGHSPFIVFPFATLVSLGTLAALKRWLPGPSKTARPSAREAVAASESAKPADSGVP